MITRILILALIASASAAPRAESSTYTHPEFKFNATVQDQGDLNGYTCTTKGAKCAEYVDALCEYLRLSIKPITVPYIGFCDVKILSDRTPDNKLEVEVGLQLNDNENALQFIPGCQTFKGALNRVLMLIRNSPKLRVVLKDITPATELPETYEFYVKGQLYSKGAAVEPNKWNDKEICEVRSQITNLNMSSELMNVMYMFGGKILRNFSVDKMTTDGKSEAAMKATFTLIYPKSFFELTGIDPKCNFNENLQWGFNNPATTAGYTLTGLELIKLEKPSAAPEKVNTIEFDYTALVTAKDVLYGQTCNNTEHPCLGYKQAVCKLAEKALVCGRLPSEGEVCSVEVIKMTANGTEVRVKLTMLSKPEDQYPLSQKCPTFGALYAQAHATYDHPKMLLQGPPASYDKEQTETEFEKFLVQGTLLRKGKKIKSAEWQNTSHTEVLDAIKNFHTTDDVTQAFIRAKRNIKDLKVDTQSENVIVSFTMEYSKPYIANSGIDPYCDLNGMIQWGFRHPDESKIYSLDADVIVNHKTAVTPTERGGIVKPTSVLYLLIINLMYLLHHA